MILVEYQESYKFFVFPKLPFNLKDKKDKKNKKKQNNDIITHELKKHFTYLHFFLGITIILKLVNVWNDIKW